MYKSPSNLPEQARARIVEQLNARLADGLDLYSQIKVAHWNVKGPLFGTIHPLLDTIASSASEFNDEIAERAVTLGGRAAGTSRQVAKASRLHEYPAETVRDLDHVRHVAERIEAYVAAIKETRAAADKDGDDDTVDLLTQVVRDMEKHGWFLRATLEG
jgi:starvation-inducible DNA-binding protein